LQYPGGGPLLVVGGAILLATGVFQFFKAAKASYLKDLEPHIARQPWAKWSGRLGYAARGFVFVITGFFLASAGMNEQASEAGDMSAALAWLDNPWDVIVAIGFLAFGLFSLIEARYRILHAVPVESLGQKIKAKFT
jgi:fructose-specific phosphotransferase system IIC component